MRFLKIKIILIAILTLTNCVSKKTNSSNDNFKYINGNEKITFELLTGNKYLEINKTTFGKFTLENIDPKNCNFVGRTIMFSKQKPLNDNECIIELSPTEEDFKEGKLLITVSYKSNGKFNFFKIEIPLKK